MGKRDSHHPARRVVDMTTDRAPSVDDWNFADIERCQPARAKGLTAAGTANDLSAELEAALRTAIANNQSRFGVDFHQSNPRVIIQFPVAQHVYDWFFSARTGYRAQFWAGPNLGDQYNRKLVATLLRPLEVIPDEITARKIDASFSGCSREEIDKGPILLRRETIAQSLEPEFAKI
jgi:hypothetical protein